MANIESAYNNYVKTPSDINEHLPTLKTYAESCEHITELGVRDAISTIGFIQGLVNNNSSNKKLIGVDIYTSDNIKIMSEFCKYNEINYKFIEESDLTITLEQTDLLFIDTWHCYGQLIRELNLHNNKVNKYIILHDTTIDEYTSEIVRIPKRWCNAKKPHYIKIKQDSGFTKYELETGLWPAVEDFLKTNQNWMIEKRYVNNNGLTILKRID